MNASTDHRPFAQTFLASTVRHTLLAAFVVSVILAVKTPREWLWGFWAGLAWLILNSYLISLLMRVAAQGGTQNSKKIMMLCMIKFPVLYLAGFGILVIPFFALAGIFVSSTLFLAVLALTALTRRTRKKGI